MILEFNSSLAFSLLTGGRNPVLAVSSFEAFPREFLDSLKAGAKCSMSAQFAEDQNRLDKKTSWLNNNLKKHVHTILTKSRQSVEVESIVQSTAKPFVLIGQRQSRVNAPGTVLERNIWVFSFFRHPRTRMQKWMPYARRWDFPGGLGIDMSQLAQRKSASAIWVARRPSAPVHSRARSSSTSTWGQPLLFISCRVGSFRAMRCAWSGTSRKRYLQQVRHLPSRLAVLSSRPMAPFPLGRSER